MKNILYLSTHSVLEFLEAKLFTELGFNVISLGAYTRNEPNNLREPILGLYDNPELREIALNCHQNNIDPRLLEWADCVVIMHNPPSKDHPQPWIANNWAKFKKSKKPIIWRSIGQSSGQIEQCLEPFRKEGLRIVRYSPREANIPFYQGADAMIRFYADPQEFNGYTGQTPRLVNISQALFGGGIVNSRGDHMNLPEFRQIVEGLDWKVFGPDNENAGDHNGGVLGYEDMKSMLRFNRAYIYTGTRPASYTLAFIDAMMTGIPIIAIGPRMADDLYKMETYEVHEILSPSGESGFWSNDLNELKKYAKMLLEDLDLAKVVGAKGRERAIELFGRDTIAEQWANYFKTIS